MIGWRVTAFGVGRSLLVTVRVYVVTLSARCANDASVMSTELPASVDNRPSDGEGTAGDQPSSDKRRRVGVLWTDGE